MTDATGAGGARDSARTPEDELPGWPGEDAPLPIEDDARARATDDARAGAADPNDDVRGMSYEAARDALIAVVDQLERGGTTLEQSLALWERGEALAARCESWLTGARARLEAARAGAQARSGG